MMRYPLRDANDRWSRGRINDETMIARELQASGMTRGDALKAAADHVAAMYRAGREPGSIKAVTRPVGDNGGPILED